MPVIQSKIISHEKKKENKTIKDKIYKNNPEIIQKIGLVDKDIKTGI